MASHDRGTWLGHLKESLGPYLGLSVAVLYGTKPKRDVKITSNLNFTVRYIFPLF
jgi:hypothetical protein